MYTRKENKKSLNNSESGPKDIPENQIVVFHVEHNKQNINTINSIPPKIYNMKKFKATTANRIEFLFAPFLEQAEKMWKQIYPHNQAQIVEVERKIYE